MPTLVNSLHPLDESTTILLSKIAESDAEGRARTAAVSALLSRGEGERDLRHAAARRTSPPLQGAEPPPELQQVRDFRFNKRKLFTDKAYEWNPSNLWKNAPETPAVPVPKDHSFWWARTDWYPENWYKWAEHEIHGDYRNGAVVFSGWVYRDNGDLFSSSFGATALFELQPARWPASATGLRRSAPVVSVSGAISGHTDGFDAWQFWEGDKWSKCWMVRRQRIFQNGLGGPILLGDRTDVQRLFERENASGTSLAALPGRLAMPALDFRIQGVADSVWATLEVRFDYQLEGDASSISFNEHPIQIAFEQWAPTAA